MSDTGCLWACGEMGEHSDLDVLVIMSDGVNRIKTAQTIYRGHRGLGFAVEIEVAHLPISGIMGGIPR